MVKERKMKANRFFLAIMAATLFLCFCSAFSLSASATVGLITCSNESKAYAVCLYDVDNDRLLYQKNIKESTAPASTAKIMTALVVYENLRDIDAEITITADMISGVNTGSLKLKEGEIFSVRTLLTAMLCGGYNDAAQALAIYTCGSLSLFVSTMNQRAAELGADATIYTDPTGLNDSARTSAWDTIRIAKQFIQYTELWKMSSLPSYEIPPTNCTNSARKIYNRNAMISNYTGSKYLNSAAKGINAGMTGLGGYCVVTGAVHEENTYLCVVLRADYDNATETVYSYVIANELINCIAKTSNATVLLPSSATIAELPVSRCSMKVKTVKLVSAENVQVYVPPGTDASEHLKYVFSIEKSQLQAPVEQGEIVGKIIVSYDEQIVGVFNIVTAESVEKDGFMFALDCIRIVVLSRLSLIVLASFSLGLAVYLVMARNPFRFKKKRVSSKNGKRTQKRKNVYRY